LAGVSDAQRQAVHAEARRTPTAPGALQCVWAAVAEHVSIYLNIKGHVDDDPGVSVLLVQNLRRE
jgi:hypothetical protein